MKKTSRIILITILSLITLSCSNENKIDESNLDLTNLDLKLNIEFEIGKDFSIANKNINNFLNQNYKDILKLDDELTLLFHSEKGKIFYSIENKKSFQKKIKENIEKNTNNQLQKSDPPGFYESSLTCVKCRSESCVKNTLTDAIGSGDDQVFISVTPNYSLGIKTSVTVCYGTAKNFIDHFSN